MVNILSFTSFKNLDWHSLVPNFPIKITDISPVKDFRIFNFKDEMCRNMIYSKFYSFPAIASLKRAPNSLKVDKSAQSQNY